MRRTMLLALAGLLLPAAPALGAPARTLEVAAGETKTWDGTDATGLNFNYFNITQGHGGAWAAPGTCTTDVQSYCDTTLVKVTNPVPDDDADGRVTRAVRVTISDYGPVPDPATDYDLLAFKSDATGKQGAELARDGNTTDTAAETVSFNVTTTREAPTQYVLVQVVYFATVASGYTGSFRF